jgi:hypothetical protein
MAKFFAVARLFHSAAQQTMTGKGQIHSFGCG